MNEQKALWWGLAAALVIAAFVGLFGVPAAPALQVVASIYALLLLGLLIYAGSVRHLPATEGRILVIANVLLFCAAYSTVRYTLTLSKDNAYALALLLSFAVSILMVCVWVLMKSKQLSRGFVGHAAHAVCLKLDGDKLASSP